MIVWIDAQLSPSLARWFRTALSVDAVAARELGLLHAPDVQMFMAARAAGAVILTKDRDFARLLDEHGPPPQVLWVTCGNTSTQRLSQVLGDAWPIVADMLSRGEALIEIGDSAQPRSR